MLVHQCLIKLIAPIPQKARRGDAAMMMNTLLMDTFAREESMKFLILVTSRTSFECFSRVYADSSFLLFFMRHLLSLGAKCEFIRKFWNILIFPRS